MTRRSVSIVAAIVAISISIFVVVAIWPRQQPAQTPSPPSGSILPTLATDSFKLTATGAATSDYRVRYFADTTDITAAVVAGTYTTPALATGDSYLVSVEVKVKRSATAGSDITRLVTITSVGDGTTQDAVMLTARGR